MEFFINVFPNKKKTQEKHPDFNVLCTIDGVQHECGLWEKDGRNGKYYAGKLKPKENKPKEPVEVDPETRATLDKMYQAVGVVQDDEIPF